MLVVGGNHCFSYDLNVQKNNYERDLLFTNGQLFYTTVKTVACLCTMTGAELGGVYFPTTNLSNGAKYKKSHQVYANTI